MKELLYLKIYTEIRDDIISGRLRPGSRLSGVRELAKEWSTSANTVLKALDVLASENLIKKTQGSGIFVEKNRLWNFSQIETANIDMFIYNLDVPFNRSLIASVEKASNDLSYNLQIKTFRSLKELNIINNEAVIIVPAKVKDEQINITADKKMPLIFAGEFNPPFDFYYNYAVADIYGGFFYLTEYLIKSGRKVISYIGAKDSFEEDAGWNAYFDVCSGIHKGAIRDYSVFAGGWSVKQGESAMKKLLFMGEYPDAVVCRNEILAAGAMAVCKQEGLRIPEDICFAAAGSHELAPFLEPPLSSLRIPADAIGLSIVNHIDNRLKGRTLPNSIFKTKFSLELMQRESTDKNESSGIDELYWV